MMKRNFLRYFTPTSNYSVLYPTCIHYCLVVTTFHTPSSLSKVLTESLVNVNHSRDVLHMKHTISDHKSKPKFDLEFCACRPFTFFFLREILLTEAALIDMQICSAALLTHRFSKHYFMPNGHTNVYGTAIASFLNVRSLPSGRLSYPQRKFFGNGNAIIY